MSRITISTIVHNKDNILVHIKSEVPEMKNTVIDKKRGKIFEEMESLLSLWIVGLNRQGATISQEVIQEKALSFFEDLKKKYPDEKDVEFKPSHGWFMRFKERRSYRSIKKQGESASADKQAATEFPNALKKIIEENGFLLEQIFNVDGTGLYWKELRDRSFFSKEEKTIPGYKVSKERVTIMLGAAEKYCKEKGIPFKVLLILDNAPGHPQNTVDFDPNVIVIYFPPNTTFLLQPMDQGMIAIFKYYYMKHTLRQAIATTDLDESITFRDFWKRYDIYKAV
ncbi:tigger transposable element-derived protein 1-like [Octopus bimaculoides]|uniref:tigger transposable element-derived protein 1-like n=1 Tax=Octopus bimaculoides TaxID=37653 RepID=UPI00071CF809|nr:tigger transposable element-derived protein 1-like [Octopus bimaculoides]|eukprot:XP_014768478.1 PREDICTED: tigger transposable element-derived protein 1-like [Octopus bimaculoides]